MRQGSSGSFMKNSEGAMAVVIGVVMIVLVGMASLAIDLGRLYTTHNNMQNTADAAALAAARALLKEDPANHNDVTRDVQAAKDAAMNICISMAGLTGLDGKDADGNVVSTPAGQRNDVGVRFGNWADHSSTWTDLGTSPSPNSTANAVQVSLTRNDLTHYGAVANYVAGAVGMSAADMTVTSRAAMTFTYSVYQGTVPVPLALPNALLVAANHNPGWWDRLFGTKEAVADTIRTYTWKDSGGQYVNSAASSASPLDPNQAYLFTVGSGDSVPQTLWNILDKIAKPSTSGSILYVDKLKLGQQIYPRSEFCWGSGYIGPIFQRLQAAYNAKKDVNGKWRVTFPIYGTVPNPLASRRQQDGFMSLARLLSPVPSEAVACYTMPPPVIYVNGFVNADITGVAYDANCDGCGSPGGGNYRQPLDGKNNYYTNPFDCLKNSSKSCWNLNYMTIDHVIDASTIIPNIPNVGGEPGGLSNKEMNVAAVNGVGAFANLPKLIPTH